MVLTTILELGLTKVDKSGLPGGFKARIYQHSILPRVLWPLITVESLERKISGFLLKWLGRGENRLGFSKVQGKMSHHLLQEEVRAGVEVE